jgi:UDP-N-acetyl-D-mannosaminuronic acid dehydrogenase
MKVSIIGLGYVGLPTALLAAKSGLEVCGIDVDKIKIDQLNKNNFYFDELELNKIYQQSLVRKNLKFELTPTPADFFVIAVPTPIQQDKTSDLRYVLQAIEAIACTLEPGNTLIIESTCPINIAEHVIKKIKSLSPELFDGLNQPMFHICYCPERVLPGNTVSEIINNPRAIGGYTKECAQQAKSFYSKFVKGEIYITDIKTAACSKLVENSFRDINIAFANELMKFSLKLGINYHELITLANQHPRVNILKPGIGVGGHCIPVDPWFLIEADQNNTSLLKQARVINDKQPDFIVNTINLSLNQNSLSNRLLVLGISYKENSSDYRDSPAIKVILGLQKLSNISEVLVYDPYNTKSEELNSQGIKTLSKIPSDLSSFDQIIQLVNHQEFAANQNLANKITMSF